MSQGGVPSMQRRWCTGLNFWAWSRSLRRIPASDPVSHVLLSNWWPGENASGTWEQQPPSTSPPLTL